MRLYITSVLVEDQENARKFYTEKLGFKVRIDEPVGEFRWLTLVSPEGSRDIQLLLEPVGFPPAKVYQKSLYDAGIPINSFETDDIQTEYERLKGLGVVFKSEPAETGNAVIAVFEDTCGNLVQLVQIDKQ